ncbi:hypothetical protein [Pseudoalteromonas piratica]|uniref:Uncharacterized protein n=1 Tax=Pseudoalteromonas piratica TaxID=1348114 RepID=A0A0A7EJL0_9GAMM|nr:hypothetical protein [Pseudoalteromonas piratica]AIY66834.1 hypothetical protein OM33_17150 [Pseudoalteromonas piratica]
MSISKIGNIPFAIQNPPASPAVQSTKENDEQTDVSDNTVTISPESWQKLKKNDDAKAEKRDALPKHIKDMIKAIERIIEQIEMAEEMLEKAKNAEYSDEKTKQAVVDSQQSFLNSLEIARYDAIQALQEAMKEAGIEDVSIITDLMR